VEELTSKLSDEQGVLQELRVRVQTLDSRCDDFERITTTLMDENSTLHQDLEVKSAEHAALASNEAARQKVARELTDSAENLLSQCAAAQEALAEAEALAAAQTASRVAAEEQLVVAQRELQRATRLQLQYAGELKKALQRPEEHADPTLVRVDGREVRGI
jgi:hypothetical protein